MKRSFKSLTALTLTMSLFSQQAAIAGGGSRDGNGSGDPAIAYTPDQVDQIKQHLNLDYLKLTPEQIADRDEQLKPIYDYYRQATEQKVVEQIQETFGTNVYQYQNTHYDFYKPSLDDKASTMDSAVRFYTGYDLDGTPFSDIDPSVLAGAKSVSINSQTIVTKRTEGD